MSNEHTEDEEDMSADPDAVDSPDAGIKPEAPMPPRPKRQKKVGAPGKKSIKGFFNKKALGYFSTFVTGVILSPVVKWAFFGALTLTFTVAKSCCNILPTEQTPYVKNFSVGGNIFNYPETVSIQDGTNGVRYLKTLLEYAYSNFDSLKEDGPKWLYTARSGLGYPIPSDKLELIAHKRQQVLIQDTLLINASRHDDLKKALEDAVDKASAATVGEPLMFYIYTDKNGKIWTKELKELMEPKNDKSAPATTNEADSPAPKVP